MVVVQVALPVPLNRSFDYLLSENMPAPVVGARVMVPFGRRQALGVVTAITDKSEFTAEQLKPIDTVLDQATLFPDDLWQLLLWSSQYYHYPIGEVLFHAMPTLLRQGKPAEFSPIWQWQITEQGKAVDITTLKRSPKQQQALAQLLRQPIYRHQVSEFELSETALQSLKKKIWSIYIRYNRLLSLGKITLLCQRNDYG